MLIMDGLNKKLAKIQTSFKSKKSRFNAFGKYYFRSAEDILEALKPFSEEMGVTFLVDEKATDIGGLPVVQSTASISDGKETITATAVVGVDLDQKGMQMPQRWGSASSYGKKYSLGNLLLIDDTQDADATNAHGGATTATKRAVDKPYLNDGTDALIKALEFITDQSSYDKVRAKYQMSNKINEILLKQIK